MEITPFIDRGQTHSLDDILFINHFDLIHVFRG